MSRDTIISAAEQMYDSVYEAWLRTKEPQYDAALDVLANIELLV